MNDKTDLLVRWQRVIEFNSPDPYEGCVNGISQQLMADTIAALTVSLPEDVEEMIGILHTEADAKNNEAGKYDPMRYEYQAAEMLRKLARENAAIEPLTREKMKALQRIASLETTLCNDPDQWEVIKLKERIKELEDNAAADQHNLQKFIEQIESLEAYEDIVNEAQRNSDLAKRLADYFTESIGDGEAWAEVERELFWDAQDAAISMVKLEAQNREYSALVRRCLSIAIGKIKPDVWRELDQSLERIRGMGE